jgi:hypothetical protein
VTEGGEDALRTGARNLVSQAGALPMLTDGTREELGPRYRVVVLAGPLTAKWHAFRHFATAAIQFLVFLML